jgi:DNA-binding GntR family transcriptional regulator
MAVVESLTQALRREILDGERPAGARLVEQELCARYGVARHSLRAALRALAAEGLIRVEPNRGARVAKLSPSEVTALYELRAALETEAAQLALERHGRMPPPVHAALAALQAGCAAEPFRWGPVSEAHGALHHAIVAAAESPRIEAAHAALSGELRLFLNQLEPLWTPERMAADHEALIEGLEREGPAVLREHLREAASALLAGTPGGRARLSGGTPARGEEGEGSAREG